MGCNTSKAAAVELLDEEPHPYVPTRKKSIKDVINAHRVARRSSSIKLDDDLPLNAMAKLSNDAPHSSRQETLATATKSSSNALNVESDQPVSQEHSQQSQDALHSTSSKIASLAKKSVAVAETMTLSQDEKKTVSQMLSTKQPAKKNPQSVVKTSQIIERSRRITLADIYEQPKQKCTEEDIKVGQRSLDCSRRSQGNNLKPNPPNLPAATKSRRRSSKRSVCSTSNMSPRQSSKPSVGSNVERKQPAKRSVGSIMEPRQSSKRSLGSSSLPRQHRTSSTRRSMSPKKQQRRSASNPKLPIVTVPITDTEELEGSAHHLRKSHTRLTDTKAMSTAEDQVKNDSSDHPLESERTKKKAVGKPRPPNKEKPIRRSSEHSGKENHNALRTQSVTSSKSSKKNRHATRAKQLSAALAGEESSTSLTVKDLVIKPKKTMEVSQLGESESTDGDLGVSMQSLSASQTSRGHSRGSRKRGGDLGASMHSLNSSQNNRVTSHSSTERRRGEDRANNKPHLRSTHTNGRSTCRTKTSTIPSVSCDNTTASKRTTTSDKTRNSISSKRTTTTKSTATSKGTKVSYKSSSSHHGKGKSHTKPKPPSTSQPIARSISSKRTTTTTTASTIASKNTRASYKSSSSNHGKGKSHTKPKPPSTSKPTNPSDMDCLSHLSRRTAKTVATGTSVSSKKTSDSGKSAATKMSASARSTSSRKTSASKKSTTSDKTTSSKLTSASGKSSSSRRASSLSRPPSVSGVGTKSPTSISKRKSIRRMSASERTSSSPRKSTTSAKAKKPFCAQASHDAPTSTATEMVQSATVQDIDLKKCASQSGREKDCTKMYKSRNVVPAGERPSRRGSSHTVPKIPELKPYISTSRDNSPESLKLQLHKQSSMDDSLPALISLNGSSVTTGSSPALVSLDGSSVATGLMDGVQNINKDSVLGKAWKSDPSEVQRLGTDEEPGQAKEKYSHIPSRTNTTNSNADCNAVEPSNSLSGLLAAKMGTGGASSALPAFCTPGPATPKTLGLEGIGKATSFLAKTDLSDSLSTTSEDSDINSVANQSMSSLTKSLSPDQGLIVSDLAEERKSQHVEVVNPFQGITEDKSEPAKAEGATAKELKPNDRRPRPKTKSRSLSPKRSSSLKSKALPEKTRRRSLSLEQTWKSRKELDESMEMSFRSFGSNSGGKKRDSATNKREVRIGGRSGRHRRPPPRTKSRSLSPEHRSSNDFPEKTRSRSLPPEKTRKSKKELQDESGSNLRSSRRNPNGRRWGRRKSAGMGGSHRSHSLSPERPQVINLGLQHQMSRSLSPERKTHGKRCRRTSMRSSQKTDQDWLDKNDSQTSNLRTRGHRSSIGSSALVAFDQVRAMLSANNFEYDEEEDTSEDSSESECMFLVDEEARKKNKWKTTKKVLTKMTKKMIGKQGSSLLSQKNASQKTSP